MGLPLSVTRGRKNPLYFGRRERLKEERKAQGVSDPRGNLWVRIVSPNAVKGPRLGGGRGDRPCRRPGKGPRSGGGRGDRPCRRPGKGPRSGGGRGEGLWRYAGLCPRR